MITCLVDVYLDFFGCVRNRIENNEGLKNRIYSLILFGSYVRGDFIDNVSDLDFFIVFNDGGEEHIPQLMKILEACTPEIKYKLIDLPSANINDLKNPLEREFPLKFLTFYRDDFLKNHRVVYGRDISDVLPSYDKETLIYSRAKQLSQAPERFKDNIELLLLSAGETAKFEAVVSSTRSISKKDITEALEKVGDKEALEIYSAYIEGKKINLSYEYLSEFIITRVTNFLKKT